MNKKKLTVALISALNITILSSIGLTFAWYGQASTLMVDGLDIKLSSGPDLQIGLRNDEEKDSIYYDHDLYFFGQKKGLEFAPVSSAYSYKWIETKSLFPKFKQEYGSGNHNFESTYKENKDATEGYFQKEFYLKSDYDCYVTISDESYVFPDEHANNKDELLDNVHAFYPSLTRDEQLQALNDVVKSIRISLLVSDYKDYSYYIIDPYKKEHEHTYLFGTLNNNKDEYYDYFYDEETNDYYSYLYGEYEDESLITYLDKSDKDSDLKYIDSTRFPSNFNSKVKKNTHHIKVDEELKNKIKGKEEDSLTFAEINYKDLIKLDEFVPKRVVLSIYFEGWDLDCTNLVMLGNFIANIKFKITKEIINI